MQDTLKIPHSFIRHASEILADTNHGLTGSKIISITSSYAAQYNVDIPHTNYPFDAPNKRTALYENLIRFNAHQQYEIIGSLCEQTELSSNDKVKELKAMLHEKYNNFSIGNIIYREYIKDTLNWIKPYPKAYKIYMSSLRKIESGIYTRNSIDDLRLSFEILLKSVFENNKSLENQIRNIGDLVSNKGGSKEFANMISKLIDYYCKYQNSYIKHDEILFDCEVEFLFDITSAFMRQIAKLHQK